MGDGLAIRATMIILVLLVGCAGNGGDGTNAAGAAKETDGNTGGDQAPPAESPLTSEDVVAAFAEAGLEAEDPTPMTPEDFGLAPMKTDDATRFLIPSLGADSGGRAFVFDDVADLRDTKAYYDELGEESAAFFSWTFANEEVGVLVQVNGELAEADAGRYEEVVAGL